MNIHGFEVTKIDGSTTALGEYAGSALLIVNVASRCGFTRQYEAMQRISDEMPQVKVLGFPCNQFGNQESGTEVEIMEFCRLTYDVTFPMFSKVDVVGDGRHPLFAVLTDVADPNGNAGAIKWNFEKFVVDPSGEAVVRFRTKVEPDADEVRQALHAAAGVRSA